MKITNLKNLFCREWQVAMTTMESPQTRVTSHDDTSKKVQDDDDFDKELESFIANRKEEESRVCRLRAILNEQNISFCKLHVYTVKHL